MLREGESLTGEYHGGIIMRLSLRETNLSGGSRAAAPRGPLLLVPLSRCRGTSTPGRFSHSRIRPTPSNPAYPRGEHLSSSSPICQHQKVVLYDTGTKAVVSSGGNGCMDGRLSSGGEGLFRRQSGRRHWTKLPSQAGGSPAGCVPRWQCG